MKLFTKEIDQKLFDQYMIGNDLENQMVVAKIFNPYGNGVWYLLNSDPTDPDYIWAIVDLFDVEMGSVSREELETLKVPPFRLGLERDLYFTPMNAKKLYDSLLRGEKFEDGGTIDIKKDQYGDNWVFPNNPQDKTYGIKLEKGGEIDWGSDLGNGFSIGNDVSITDRKSLFNGKTGFVSGVVGKDLLITISENGNEKSVVVSKNGVERLDAPEFAAGGMTAGRFYKDNAGQEFRYIGESQGKLLFKDGEKVVFKNESDFAEAPTEKRRFGFFGYGGVISKIDQEIAKYENENSQEASEKVKELIERRNYFLAKELHEEDLLTGESEGERRAGMDEYASGGFTSSFSGAPSKKFVSTMHKMAKGGEMDDEGVDLFEDYNDIPESVQKVLDNHSDAFENEDYKGLEKAKKDLEKIGYTFEYGLDGTAYDLRKIGQKGKNEDEYAKGGVLTDAKKEAILRKKGNIIIFKEVLEPTDEGRKSIAVQGFVKSRKTGAVKIEGSAYDTQWFDSMQDLINAVDWSKWEGNKYAKGGELMKHKHLEYVTIELIEPTSKGWKVKQIETHSVGGRKLSTPKEKVAYFSKEEIKDLFEPTMAKGGTTKFKDKVQSIKASLLKRKKVSPKVQKDYGKTYSPKEAEDSAKRIVGSMVKKEKRQPRVSKMLEKMKKGTQLNKKKSTFKDRMKDLSTKIKERKSKTTK